jgi:hypothetical protein
MTIWRFAIRNERFVLYCSRARICSWGTEIQISMKATPNNPTAFNPNRNGGLTCPDCQTSGRNARIGRMTIWKPLNVNGVLYLCCGRMHCGCDWKVNFVPVPPVGAAPAPFIP